MLMVREVKKNQICLW